MKTTTIIILAAGAVAAFILLRPKAVAPAPKKGTADVLAGAFNFGSAVAGVFDDDEDSR